MGITCFTVRQDLHRGAFCKRIETVPSSNVAARPLQHTRKCRVSLRISRKTSERRATACYPLNDAQQVESPPQRQAETQQVFTRVCRVAAGTLAFTLWLKVSAHRPAPLFASSTTAVASNPGTNGLPSLKVIPQRFYWVALPFCKESAKARSLSFTQA